MPENPIVSEFTNIMRFFLLYIIKLIILLLFTISIFAAPSNENSNKHLIPFNKTGKFGYSDQEKKIVLPAIYDYAFPFSDGLARVTINENVGFIDSNGKEVVPIIYEQAGDFLNEITWSKLNGQFFLINKFNQNLATFIKIEKGYIYEPIFFHEGLAVIRINDKYGFINYGGSLAIPADFEEASRFSDGLALVKKSNKYGFINKTGEVIIPFIYDSASSFSEGLAFVRNNNKCGYINKFEQLVITFKKCKDGKEFLDGRAIFKVGEKYTLIDRSGSFVTKNFFDYIDYMTEGLSLVTNIINGKEKYGFVDRNGKIKIQLQFDYAQSFSEGLAKVAINGKEGFINHLGKIIIPLKYDGATSFENELSSVYIKNLNGKWVRFYIGKDGTEYYEP